MRKIITTWMLEVSEEHGCEEQVFPMAINFLDRFLAACPIKPNQLQLSATVSLLLASKVRMCTPLSVYLLSMFTDRSITPKQIKDWELLFLSKLQWEVCGVTGCDFIDHILEGTNLVGTCNMLRPHTITLLSLAYTESDLASIRGSVLACAALVSAARGLRMKPDVLNDVCTLIKCDPNDVESIVARIEVILSECAVHQTYSDSNSLCL
ncbi:unnamed protein product [Nezara viridula]|uniref:Uncharacterized protein n=1 Tax=Nezara viridula TaxID=85310 RepID=A0A9P0MY32_NEZVI|nr:unnamed protein product [Nezara viridula]